MLRAEIYFESRSKIRVTSIKHKIATIYLAPFLDCSRLAG